MVKPPTPIIDDDGLCLPVWLVLPFVAAAGAFFVLLLMLGLALALGEVWLLLSTRYGPDYADFAVIVTVLVMALGGAFFVNVLRLHITEGETQ